MINPMPRTNTPSMPDSFPPRRLPLVYQTYSPRILSGGRHARRRLLFFVIGRVECSQPDRFNQANRIGHSLTRNIICRTVINGGSQDRHAAGDRNGAVEVHHFGGDMPLVMVRRQYGIPCPSRAKWNTLSAGFGPSIAIPCSRASSIPGNRTSSSSWPNRPCSPPWGLIAATTSLGCGTPSCCSARVQRTA